MVRGGFDGVQDRAAELFGEQRFTEAYELVTRAAADHPDRDSDASYLRSCAAARMGDFELAVEIIREAMARGVWFGEFPLRRSPSWQPLQGMPAFEECVARQRAAAIPAYHRTALPENARPPYRSVVTLHGNGQNSEASMAGWRDVVVDGRLLAAVQSSQIIGVKESAIWDDEDAALTEVTAEFEALAAEHELDHAHVVLAGFSMGAETALRLVLGGAVPARGFVLHGPGGPRTHDPDSWLPLIEGWQLTGGAPLRGYVMVGAEDDEVPTETHRRLTEILTEHGIPCGFEVVPGIGHEYPADFLPAIRRALAFVDPDD